MGIATQITAATVDTLIAPLLVWRSEEEFSGTVSIDISGIRNDDGVEGERTA